MNSKHSEGKKGWGRFFDAAGYLAWVVQLLLLVLLYFQGLKESSIGRMVFPTYVPGPTNASELTDTQSVSLSPSVLLAVITVLAVLGMVICIIYVTVRYYVPTVNKTADKVVETTAKQALKQVERVRHKQLSPVKRKIFTRRIAFWTKISVSLVPFVITLLVMGSPLIPRDYAVMTMAGISLWAVVCFVLSSVSTTITAKNK